MNTNIFFRKEAQKFAPRRTAPIHSPHGGGPGTGAPSQKGSMPTETAGRNPWGRADGGLATMFQRR